MAFPNPVTALPGDNAAAVTLSDTAIFPPSLLYVGAGGTINVTTAAGQDVQFTMVAGGTVPVLCTKARLGGTASAIVRIY